MSSDVDDRKYELFKIWFICLKMGMVSIHKGADLSGLLNAPESIYVQDVIHQTVIEINEHYTKAAAATG